MKTALDIIKNKGSVMFTVDENTVVKEAIKIMKDNKIGAVLVTREGEIAGIWTERDLMKNCLQPDFDLNASRIGPFMTTDLIFANHNDNLFLLLDKFLGKRIRHLPIKQDGRIIGLISSGDVVRASMDDKDRELRQLNAMVSWDYYENWRWDKTKTPPIVHNEEGLRVDSNPVD